MDGLECDVCQEVMNEGKLRPRSLKCGHTACTICINKLILNNTLKCPSCRQSYKIHCIDELPVNFAVIKMIRALKGVTISHEPDEASAKPRDKNLCIIHDSFVIKRCQMGQVRICEHCIEHHKQESDTSTTSVEDALKEIKENHIKSAQSKMDGFKHDLELVSERICDIEVKKFKLHEKILELEEDEIKLSKLLRDGNSVLDAAVTSHNSLTNANNPQDINDQVHASLQQECYLELWRKKNISYLELWTNKSISNGSITSMLNSGKEVYSVLKVNGTQYGARLYLKHDVVQLHPHKADPIPTNAISIPYECIRELVEVSPVTFLEISINGTPKVELHIRLHKNKPNMAKSFTILCSGELGTNLIGLEFRKWGNYFLQSKVIVKSLNFPQLPLDPVTDENTNAVMGSIVGQISKGNVSEIGLLHKGGFRSPIASWRLVGEIIEGLPNFISIVNSTSIKNVKISNCGIILQRN